MSLKVDFMADANCEEYYLA